MGPRGWLWKECLLDKVWGDPPAVWVQQNLMVWWLGVAELANLASLVPAVRVGLVYSFPHKPPPHSCLVGVARLVVVGGTHGAPVLAWRDVGAGVGGSPTGLEEEECLFQHSCSLPPGWVGGAPNGHIQEGIA